MAKWVLIDDENKPIRYLVACELDADYFEAACKRIKAEASQERLF